MPYRACIDRDVVPTDDELSAWTPPERLTICEWAERYRVLTKPPAEEPGPLRLDRTPYLRPIMDMVQRSEVEQIVLCKSAQIAGTEAMLSILGYYVHQEPCSAMLVMADQDTAVYMSRERIQKMFTASRELSRVFIPELAAKGEITLANGSYIALGWASSVARLASRPMRIVVLDEVDKPGYYVTTREADPVSLAVERTETFYNRKIMMLSTPTFEDGNIWQQLESCDVIYDWHVPCPYCGQFQPLRWSKEYATGFEKGHYRADDGADHPLGGVVWEGGREATRDQILAAGYKCGECGETWTTTEKNRAVTKGKMVPRADTYGHNSKIGFHLNRLYALLGRSGDIPKLVEDWIRAVRSKESRIIQGFVNGSLAEPYRYQAQERKEATIMALRDDRPRGVVPSAGVVALTCGADTQDDGFFYTVYGWGVTDPSDEGLDGGLCEPVLSGWLVREGFVDSLAALWQIVSGSYQDVYGGEYIIKFALIDAMGHRTAEVYDWSRHKAQVRPVKGEQQMNAPYAISQIDTYPGTKKPISGGLKLYRLNSTYYKDMLHRKLAVASADPGAIHFHGDIGEEFAAQMVAEFRNDHGLWTCPHWRANHYWDCTYMALAAADIIGVQHWRRPTGDEPQNINQAQSSSKRRGNPYIKRGNPFTRRRFAGR